MLRIVILACLVASFVGLALSPNAKADQVVAEAFNGYTFNQDTGNNRTSTISGAMTVDTTTNTVESFALTLVESDGTVVNYDTLTSSAGPGSSVYLVLGSNGDPNLQIEMVVQNVFSGPAGSPAQIDYDDTDGPDLGSPNGVNVLRGTFSAPQVVTPDPRTWVLILVGGLVILFVKVKTVLS